MCYWFIFSCLVLFVASLDCLRLWWFVWLLLAIRLLDCLVLFSFSFVWCLFVLGLLIVILVYYWVWLWFGVDLVVVFVWVLCICFGLVSLFGDLECWAVWFCDVGWRDMIGFVWGFLWCLGRFCWLRLFGCWFDLGVCFDLRLCLLFWGFV